MSSVSELNRSMLRITGIASGLDTESIVNDLLKVDQYKVDKQFKIATKLEWKGDAYREVNLALKNFREKYMSVLSPDTNMYSSNAYKAFSATLSTQTSAVSITAGSTATAGSMTINKITQLAASATISSSSGMFTEGTINSTLKEAFGEGMFDEEGNISFSINGEEFTFSEDTTIGSMVSTINSNSNVGVTVSFSSLKKNFTFSGKATGESNTFTIVNLSGTAFAESADDAAFKIAAGTYKGKNAKLQIEGVDVERSSNTFTIDGITYSLKESSDSEIKFNIARDIDSTYKKIVEFIDAYNTLIADLQARIDEKVYSDYSPLTESEREELTDTQATQWEAKAKSGILKGDSGISTLLQNLRSAFYTAVADTGKSPASIGLKTGAYATTGKIVIDEKQLRTALENNPDEVAKIFTNISTSTDAKTKNSESGLVVRLSNALNQYVETSTSVTLANNANAITQANNRLDQLEDWLANNEEKYWAKFTAMETALASLNSQSSWLSSLLSGVNG